MRKADLAEWVLSLIVPRDEAASIAGDLTEDEAARGGTRFWASIAGTLLRQTARRIVSLPGSTLFLSGISWFTYMTVGVVLAIASLVVASAAAFTIDLLTDHTGVGLFLSSVSAAEVRVALEMASIWALAPAITGAMLARRARGFEMPMALVVSVCWFFLATLVPFVGHDTRASDGMLVIIPCLIAGAARERRIRETA